MIWCTQHRSQTMYPAGEWYLRAVSYAVWCPQMGQDVPSMRDTWTVELKPCRSKLNDLIPMAKWSSLLLGPLVRQTIAGVV